MVEFLPCFEDGRPDTHPTLKRSRSRAPTAVKAASIAIPQSWALAGCAASRLRSAAGSDTEVARGIPVTEAAAPTLGMVNFHWGASSLCMGSYWHSAGGAWALTGLPNHRLGPIIIIKPLAVHGVTPLIRDAHSRSSPSISCCSHQREDSCYVPRPYGKTDLGFASVAGYSGLRQLRAEPHTKEVGRDAVYDHRRLRSARRHDGGGGFIAGAPDAGAASRSRRIGRRSCASCSGCSARAR